jgi:hypothetical protein
MNFLRIASAVVLTAGMAFVSPAGAAPVGPSGMQPSSQQGLVTKVGGCHSDVRRHYVPEFGRSTEHRHLRNCRPVRVEERGRDRDCHREARRHYVPGIGSVVHRHVGPNCRVRVLRRYDSGGRDCVQIGPIRYCEG